MLEWYRTGAPLAHLMSDCAALVALAAHVSGAKTFVFRGRKTDPFEPPERMTARDAFLNYAGLDLYDSLPVGRAPDRATLARQAKEIGLRIADDDTWSDIFSRLLTERVEPNLGLGRPTILYAYPASEAALARTNHDDPRVAERFELYCCGVELANAFDELTDPVEQRRRFDADMAEQQRIYGNSNPIDEDFLNALVEMPAASGAALGFDRLMMLATGADRIDAVQWTPVFDAETSSMTPDSPLMAKARTALARVYGFSAFRPGQEDILASTFQGKDVLAVMPTGSGKSLCFQLPPIVRDGLTLVVSPLIALMRNQVAQLHELGVEAAKFQFGLLTPMNVGALLAAFGNARCASCTSRPNDCCAPMSCRS